MAEHETTHAQIAVDLLAQSEKESDAGWAQVRATQAVAHALFAAADPLHDALSIFRQSREFTARADLAWPLLERTDAEGVPGALERLREGLRLTDRDVDGRWQYVRARVSDLRSVLPIRTDEPEAVVWEIAFGEHLRPPSWPFPSWEAAVSNARMLLANSAGMQITAGDEVISGERLSELFAGLVAHFEAKADDR